MNAGINKRQGVTLVDNASAKKQWFTLNKENAPYIFLSPIIILFALFMLYPIVQSFIYSFQEIKGGAFQYVGADNYIRLFKDEIFLKALSNTFYLLIIQVPIMIMLAFLLAVLINSSLIRFKTFFRISFFMPAITALVAYAIIFQILLNTEYGVLNYVLSWLGIHEIEWLGDPFWAKVALILSITWRWVGYNTVFILAGLQTIPDDLYEAASIDGAGKVRKFCKITVPLMKPIILFCVVLSTIGTLQLFDESYILTRGGPHDSTLTVAHYLYKTGFRYFKFGYASAISYVLVVLIAVLSYIQFKYLGGGKDEEN